MKVKTPGPFWAITFGLTWGLAALLMLFYDQIVAIFGEVSPSNPLFILAVYSPGIAGVFLVWRYYGLHGLGSFFRRLTLWRAPALWWLFLIVGIPAIVYTGAAVNGTFNEPHLSRCAAVGQSAVHCHGRSRCLVQSRPHVPKGRRRDGRADAGRQQLTGRT